MVIKNSILTIIYNLLQEHIYLALSTPYFRGRMRSDDLEIAIRRSIEQDMVPLMVNATCGTTVLGAFDPVNAIADVCENYGVWLHVDVRCPLHCVLYYFHISFRYRI